MTSPTVMDIARHMGAVANESGGINGGEFARLGLPIMGGCAVCGASIAAYNAYPGTNGYLVGSCCEPETDTFENIERFLEWWNDEGEDMA